MRKKNPWKPIQSYLIKSQISEFFSLENIPLRLDLKYHKKRRDIKRQPGKQGQNNYKLDSGESEHMTKTLIFICWKCEHIYSLHVVA